jgi:hypothetical protein
MSFSLLRCAVWGPDGIRWSSVGADTDFVQDCYIRGMGVDPDHADGLQALDGTTALRFEHNTVEMRGSTSTACFYWESGGKQRRRDEQPADQRRHPVLHEDRGRHRPHGHQQRLRRAGRRRPRQRPDRLPLDLHLVGQRSRLGAGRVHVDYTVTYTGTTITCS